MQSNMSKSISFFLWRRITQKYYTAVNVVVAGDKDYVIFIDSGYLKRKSGNKVKKN